MWVKTKTTWSAANRASGFINAASGRIFLLVFYGNDRRAALTYSKGLASGWATPVFPDLHKQRIRRGW